MRNKLLIAAALLCLLAFVGFTYQAPQKWEYKIDSPRVTEDKLDAGYLTTLGGDGWELVAVERDGPRRTYFFKRPAK